MLGLRIINCSQKACNRKLYQTHLLTRFWFWFRISREGTCQCHLRHSWSWFRQRWRANYLETSNCCWWYLPDIGSKFRTFWKQEQLTHTLPMKSPQREVWEDAWCNPFDGLYTHSRIVRMICHFWLLHMPQLQHHRLKRNGLSLLSRLFQQLLCCRHQHEERTKWLYFHRLGNDYWRLPSPSYQWMVSLRVLQEERSRPIFSRTPWWYLFLGSCGWSRLDKNCQWRECYHQWSPWQAEF